jgi:hypothetical protein
MILQLSHVSARLVVWSFSGAFRAGKGSMSHSTLSFPPSVPAASASEECTRTSSPLLAPFSSNAGDRLGFDLETADAPEEEVEIEGVKTSTR